MTRRAPVLLCFFASGVSGLIYELVWIRQFGTLFGSSVFSAALVTAIYMGGLGLGGWLAGTWSDRRFRADPVLPLRWYGVFELSIGGLAALAALLVPLLAPVAAAAASYELGANGWYWLATGGSLVRYAIAALLLLPITLLMGATLTLLIRYVVADDLAGAGWQIGLVYGVNTAGAALGCLATDTALVPLLGIRATQATAVAMNGLAGVGALWLARAAAAPPAEKPPPAAEIGGSDARLRWTAAALALTGFASMAMQIVWFRHLISMLGAFRPVFSMLLFVILLGIWLGSLLGGRLARRGEAASLYAMALAGFVISAEVALALMRHGEAIFGPMPSPEVASAWRWPVLYGRLLGRIGWVVGPAALFAGATYPLANAIVQRGPDRVGARAGLLYLATTAGGVLGSLVAGFGLLPRLGVQATVAVAGLCVVAALLCVWRTTRGAGAAPRGRGVLAVAGALAGVAVGAWSLLPDEYLLRRSLPLAPGASGRGVLAVHEGVNETLAVVAQRGPALALMTNGHNMSKTSLSAQRYMDAFVHVPLLLRDDVENVMVMCFGVGNTTAAALRHPGVKRVDVVDLSYDVLAHAEYFDRVNGRPLEDPRVDVYVNDARHHLLMLEGEAYDLVTGEPPPITHAGVVNLYTREFFELVRSRLRPGGLATYWLPLGQVGDGAARSMVRAFLDVFPNAVLLSGYRTHLILVGRKGGRIEIDPAAVARRLASQPALRDDLRPLSLDSPVEIVGMLAATPETLERATRGVAPLRDDDPILEYAVHELQADGRIPADLVSVADLPHWCPRCWNGGLDPDDARRLRGYLEVMARYYASEAFLASRLDVPVLRVAELSEEAKRATEESLYLRDLLSLLSPLHRRALALERHGRPGLAVASLERVVRAHPGDTRAREDLAWLRARVAVPSR